MNSQFPGWRGLIPDPIYTVTEWADKYRILTTVSSAEAGPWRTSRTPYLKEIMDSLSVTSPVQRVVFMKGSQIGGSECGNNWIGYIIDHAPGPILSVQPSLDLAKRNSRQRITPLIESSDKIKGKVTEGKSRDGSNTILVKEFSGGILVMAGANSATALRSLPARYGFYDEIDAYPLDVDGEGDPVELADKRTATFGDRKKVFLVSTPTIAGMSRIEFEYDQTDQCRYFIPCPRCGEFQWLKWVQVQWTKGDEENAHYKCEHCNGKIENWEKTKFLSLGEWRPTNEKADRRKIRGFHLSSLYSPVGWVSWGELARQWRKSQVSTERLRVFFNTILGETWKEKGEAPEWKRLYEKREHYPTNSVPAPVAFLTAGVDVQKDRVEVEIKGWSRDKVSYSIDYRVYPGDTSSMGSSAWLELSKLLSESWRTKSGIDIPIKMMAVDSGFNTQTVYAWVRQHSPTRVIAIKGMESTALVIGTATPVDVTVKGKKIRRGLRLFPIGTPTLKSELYGWLKQEKKEGEPEPQGFCHFPEYDEEYFKQLCGEQLVGKVVRGYKRWEWQKTRERNEALDCAVYNRAAASVLGMDRLNEDAWNRLEMEVGFVRASVSNPVAERGTNENEAMESDDNATTEQNIPPENLIISQNNYPLPTKKVRIIRRKSNFL